MGGWVYIMTNKHDGVLYIGVTADLPARVMQHRTGKGSAFCRRYGLDRLVYAEPYSDIHDAIVREKAMKAWKRAWKIELIENSNPDWGDLFERLAWPTAIPAFAGMTMRGQPSQPPALPHHPSDDLDILRTHLDRGGKRGSG